MFGQLKDRGSSMAASAIECLYFLRLPRTTNTAPEINAIALPADAGLISGTVSTAKAALPTPMNSKTVPNSFTLRLLLTLNNLTLNNRI
jgi:hypothetical protein